MTSQQLSETVISTIRANIANVEDLSVMDTPATIPDKNITETKDAYGNILLDADGNKFVDDYCYIYYDPVNGGIVINNYDPDTKTRSSASIGEARRLNMNYSAFTEVKFSLWDDTCLDVQADSFLMENANPANKVATSNYSLSTSIATDENVVQLDEYMDPIRIGTYNCIRFRRMNAGKNYQWSDVTNYEINPDGMTQQEVKLGGVSITDAAAGKGKGQVVAYNQKDTPWLWELNNQALSGKKILSCTSSTMSCAVAADGLSVTFKPKNALGRTENWVAYDFEFTFQPDSGEQKVEVTDKNDGTGFITVTNTCAGSYDWSTTFSLGSEMTDFKIVNPTAGGGTCTNNFPTSSTATSVTVSGSMPHNDSPVGINFTYKVNTGDVTVVVNKDDSTMSGTVTVTNTKKTNENWEADIAFSKMLDTFNISEAATEGGTSDETSVKVRGVIVADSSKTYNFTYTYKSTDLPFEVSYKAKNERDGDYNGVQGHFTDIYVIIKNPNDSEKTKDWTCAVTFSGTVQVVSSYGSVNYTNPLSLNGNIKLAANETTNESDTGNYIKLTYFQKTSNPGEVTVHFDNINIQEENGGKKMVGFYEANKGPFKSNYVTTDYTFTLSSTDVLMLKGVYSNNYDYAFNNINGGLSYAQIVSQGIKDIYIVGKQVYFNSAPAGFRVAQVSGSSVEVTNIGLNVWDSGKQGNGTVKVKNTGTSAAKNVRVTYTFANPVTFDSGSQVVNVVGNGTTSITVSSQYWSDLNANEEKEVYVVMKPAGSGPIQVVDVTASAD